MKSKKVKEVEKWLNSRKKELSALPAHAVPKVALTATNANALTKSIVTYLNYLPECFAYRVNNGGVYDAKIGRHRVSHTIKGIADIDCTYKGMSIKIEVKYGSDRLSDHQKKYRDRVKAAGGYFIVAKNLDQFFIDFEKIAKGA